MIPYTFHSDFQPGFLRREAASCAAPAAPAPRRLWITPPGRDRTLRRGDRVFVRVRALNEELLHVMMGAVGDMGEIFAEVRRLLPDRTGLVTVTVRNRSRGWTEDRSMMLGPRGRRPAAPSLRCASGF